METVKNLLNEAIQKNNLKNYAELAKKIGVSQKSINYYKNGKTTPEMFVMMKLAMLTNRKLEEVIAMINIEREKNEKKKNFWIEIYKKITG
jgi:predicted transcriptional regulator